MPRIERRVVVNVAASDAFALSQSQGEVRYRWDPFVVEQRLLNGAKHPAKGVIGFTKSRHRLTMEAEYTSFRPPNQVGMRMVKGPPFFATFGGGWTFREIDESTTEAIWRYTFSIRPSWLSRLGDPIGSWFLGRDIRRRIDGFAAGCADPDLIADARRQLDDPT